MRLDLEAQGAEELVDRLVRASDVVEDEIGTAVRRSGELVRAAVIRAAPGRARNGVRIRHEGYGASATSEVYLVGVAIPIATGAKPHEIEARRGRVLAFGRNQFATRVSHPGTAANPFFRRGVERAEPDIEQGLADAAERVVETITER